MAPVILALKQQPWAEVRVLATGQHRDMLDQVLAFFGIEPDIDLNVMMPNQALTPLTARLLLEVDKVFLSENPDIVLSQGDTTTVMTIALACFYHNVAFGHIEAGLRTGDIRNPFPEEANRVIASRLARWHFAPTSRSADNLLKEGVPQEDIIVTGNTGIDALLMTAETDIDLDPDLELALDDTRRLILVTSHRRENFGEPFLDICHGLSRLAENNTDIQILYPVHPNPHIRETAYKYLADKSNIILCEPLDYPAFVAVMKRAYLIISDSGGVQEEAPALSKPVLVLREKTERPEAVDLGVVKLVGANSDAINCAAQKLLDDEVAYREMARGGSPYGDGKAAMRIVDFLRGIQNTCN